MIRRVQPAGVALLRLVLLLLGTAGAAAAQDKVLHWERYDVDVEVEPRGSILVVEDQLLAFDKGSFRFGVRSIAHQRLRSVEILSVSDGAMSYRQASSERPGTYRVQRQGSTTDVRYFFPPGGAGEKRRILIRYRVEGALRSYPDKGVDQLDWKAIPAGNPFPTEASTLTVRTPEGAGLIRIGVQGWSGETELASGQSVGRVSLRAPIPAHREVELVAEWPAGVVAVSKQGWQDEVDRRAAGGASHPLFTLLFLALGALLAIGGPVGCYVLWHERGRDPEVGLMAEELREPPSELRPGIVGSLIDEKADLRDVVATMVDLARKGHLQIRETQSEGFFGLFRSRDFELIGTGAPPPDFASEQVLLSGLLGTESSRMLSELSQKFYKVLPKVQEALTREATEAGLFVENPARVRQRWGCGAALALVLGEAMTIAIAVAATRLTGAAWALPIGWGVAALALVLVSARMPRKTRKGAEEYARWLAFRRHLVRARKWRDVELDPKRVDRWLPYAIAFGLESELLAAFESSTAPAPAWWLGGRPGSGIGPGARSTGMGWSPPSGGHGGAGGGSSGGGLSGASAGLGASLGAMSAGVGGLLASASRTLASTPSSSGGGGGGGFSGGGGSFGGGSGGGGSSFG